MFGENILSQNAINNVLNNKYHHGIKEELTIRIIRNWIFRQCNR